MSKGKMNPGEEAEGTLGHNPIDPRGQIKLSPFYHSAVNAVTEPNRQVFCSRYLIERWSPLLGGTGLQILLYLRAHCFHDRRTGERREHWQVSRSEIAAAIGVSETTVKREMNGNEALRRFVQPQQEYRLDGGRGGIRRDANSYRIAMDDPIHDDDWPRVEAYVREAEADREKGALDPAEDAKRRARSMDSASGQIGPTPPHLIDGVKLARTDAPLRVNLAPHTGQFDPANMKEDSLTTLTNVERLETFNVEPAIHNFSFPDRPAGRRSEREAVLDRLAAALATELDDRGSERRHRQLLDLCERHGLDDLARRALEATRARLARVADQGPLERPGAYYARILTALLEERQVFVPTAAEKGEDDPSEVRLAARQSLGLPASDAPPGHPGGVGDAPARQTPRKRP